MSWKTNKIRGEREVVCLLHVYLNSHLAVFLCFYFSAPEVVNYEPLGLEADMW